MPAARLRADGGTGGRAAGPTMSRRTAARRAATLQLALVAILTGLMLVLLGGGGAEQRETPQRRTYRPATELERQQREAELLREEMDRLWEQRQR